MNTDNSEHGSQRALCRVVVADDNKITLRLASTWLEKAGYSVSCASDGEEALRVIEATDPSILVTDWNMPKMTGLELCRAIRRGNRPSYLYVLMVTAREVREHIVQAIDAGADDFLSKPLKAEELIARVEQAEAAVLRFRQSVDSAETDSLTRAMNRRRFNEYCVRGIAQAAQDGEPLSCALLDIDRFKHINDTYGHSVGDEALRMVAEVLRQCTRDGDRICRYGGDEFCVLLPGMKESDACAFADRVRGAITARTVNAGQRGVQVKATVGVAQWREDILTPRQLIDLADEALLAAKRSGRNRVVGYGAFTNLNSMQQAPMSQVHDRFSGLVAGDIMTTPLVTLCQNSKILKAADLFLRLRVNSVPIIDDKSKLVGIISESDVVNSLSSNDDWNTLVRQVMKKDVVSYEVNSPVTVIWDYLRRVTLRRVVIVDEGVPIGVVSRGSLLRWLGNWEALSHRRATVDRPEAVNILGAHMRDVISAITEEGERFNSQDWSDADEAVARAVTMATRMQEQSQDLLALCQVHYRFEPHSVSGEDCERDATDIADENESLACPVGD